ncbi:sensor histidine kinase [Marinobacter sp.]|uniref:sensor histidine kinase n=1 Tax=Marinobacter sp. TaxID=50741 RepID=UPI00384B9BF2
MPKTRAPGSIPAPAPARPDQRERLFRIYNQYRLVISLSLVVLLFVDIDGFDTRYRLLGYYQTMVISYLALNIFTGLVMLAGFHPQQRHITLSILLDIVFMHGFLVFSGGITSGLANLIIIAVAAGNILIPTRVGIFYAALAALGSLAVASWSVLAFGETADEIVRAGSLGILYFAAAFLLQNITRRMIKSEELASSRAQSILELEQINQQIIQRMRTGILVTDRFGRIRLANAAAEELLFGNSNEDTSRQLALPAPLRSRLEQWLRSPALRAEPFQANATSPPLQANFTRLHQEEGDQILVFIEDMSKVTQQAQQMKLASLGRLTAGIAHEIRNPLGAISHAAQLMNESRHLEAADRKMLEIVQRHSRRVNGIIENVLDLSRRQPADSERVDIAQWLEEFVEDYQQTARSASSRPVQIQLELPARLPPAPLDRSQMEQVLVNLCDNGLRYSEAQTGEPLLKISAGATADGERTYIDIRDYGPGISAENRTSVFEPFFTTDKSGTGLGLYLARELCEANQAHLALLQDNLPGCCFRITFAHQGRLI